MRVVSSPPFGQSLESTDRAFNGQARPGRTVQCAEYGTSAGQLGTEPPGTFWEAAHAIVSQCFQLLPPGGIAMWVTKAYVKQGAIVDFPGQ